MLALIFPSCVGGSRGLVSAVVEVAPHYHEGGSFETAAPVCDPWWEAFHEGALDRFMKQALSRNLELQAAAARIAQAEAAFRQAGGQLLPQVTADGSFGTRWILADADDASSNRETSADLGGLLDWELDLWGRLRAARDARRLEREATVADWQGARLLLSVAVAETYFELLEQQRQLRLLEEQIEAGQTLLDLTELRFGQAQSSVVDVLQQREQLAATKTLVPIVEGRLRQLQYALDVLLGRAPGTGSAVPERKVPVPPTLGEIGVPMDLWRQRPDLLAAMNRVVALDREVAEAIADRLPRVSLRTGLSSLGSPRIDTIVANALAAVAAPLIDGGVRQAEIAKRRAALQEALATLSNAYLEAVRDVETALALERAQGKHLHLLEEQLDTAQSLLRESRNRYRQGLTDYLPVLTALVTVQRLERDRITSRREWLSARIALHRALGGPMGKQSR